MPETWTHERIVRLILETASAQRDRGDRIRAERWLKEALQMVEGGDSPGLVAAVKASLGVLARATGDGETAARRLDEALSLRRQADDTVGIARTLAEIGRLHLDEGRIDRARELVSEAMEMTAAVEPGPGAAEILEYGALIHDQQGDGDRSKTLRQQALRIFEEIGDVVGAARVRVGLEGHPDGAGSADLDDEIRLIERSRLLTALEKEGWNQSRAARLLGVTETRVRNLMRKHGLRSRNRRGRPRKSTTESRET